MQLGLGPQTQLPQRRVVRLVGPATGHRHVDPVQRPPEARRQRIGDLHQLAGIGGLLEVPVLDVAVAEVISQLDVRGHLPGEPQQALENAALDVLEPDRKDALEHCELEVGVPLHGDLVVGYLPEDRLQLGEQPLLVTALKDTLMLGNHEGADRSQRRGQADLEATGHRHEPVTLQPCEDAIRRDRCFRVPQGLENHTVGPDALAETDSRQRPPAVGAWRNHLELRLGGEDRELPDDPVRARAGLAVGDAAQAIPDLGAHRLKDDLRAREGYAAHQMGPLRDGTSARPHGERSAGLIIGHRERWTSMASSPL